MTDATRTTDTQHIREAVERLHLARLEAIASGEVVRAAQDAFNEEHAEIIANLKSAAAKLQQADAAVRELVVAHYHQTAKADPNGEGDKQPLPGVGVKVGTEFEFSVDDALAFAREKQMCLTPESLDTKAFLDICKVDSARPDFVKVKKIPKPAIAADLTKAISSPETEAPATAGAVA